MRVVAGTAGGRRLKGPTNEPVRPTTDKVRGAIFNSLASLGVVEGATVLDLFAGTGACGIEALSRGAGSVTFVEKDARVVRIIKENLATTGFSAAVVRADVLAYLRSATPVDLVIADPPYAFDRWHELLGLVPASLVVAESGGPITVPDGWETVRARRYGDTEVTILRRQA